MAKAEDWLGNATILTCLCCFIRHVNTKGRVNLHGDFNTRISGLIPRNPALKINTATLDRSITAMQNDSRLALAPTAPLHQHGNNQVAAPPRPNPPAVDPVFHETRPDI